jgi:hypothetical protein
VDARALGGRGAPHGTRGDLAHHLAQALADRAAAAEGRRDGPLPRLDDLALADQLAVTATTWCGPPRPRGGPGGDGAPAAAPPRPARRGRAARAGAALGWSRPLAAGREECGRTT